MDAFRRGVHDAVRGATGSRHRPGPHGRGIVDACRGGVSVGVTVRLLIVTLCLAGSTVMIGRASKSDEVPPREQFNKFPETVGDWIGRPDPPLTQHVLDVLGVDDYLSRTYMAKKEAANLYIGYYHSQREGDTIHSPLNCLPGAGWEPIEKTRISLKQPDGRPMEVNQLLIEKGIDHQLVLYWYQSHGRIVASEYWGKAYMVFDALRLNRTDGAMVRVITGVGDNIGEGKPRAASLARSFAETVFPLLNRFLPG